MNRYHDPVVYRNRNRNENIELSSEAFDPKDLGMADFLLGTFVFFLWFGGCLGIVKIAGPNSDDNDRQHQMRMVGFFALALAWTLFVYRLPTKWPDPEENPDGVEAVASEPVQASPA